MSVLTYAHQLTIAQWAVALATCLLFAPSAPAQEPASDIPITWTSRYIDCDAGYSIALPEGVVGFSPSTPYDGFIVNLTDLKWQNPQRNPVPPAPASKEEKSKRLEQMMAAAVMMPERRIRVFHRTPDTALPDAPKTQAEFVAEELESYRRELDNWELIERRTVFADGLPAEHIRSKFRLEKQEMVLDAVLVYRPKRNALHRLVMVTTKVEHPKDIAVLERLFAGMHFTDLPMTECPNVPRTCGTYSGSDREKPRYEGLMAVGMDAVEHQGMRLRMVSQVQDEFLVGLERRERDGKLEFVRNGEAVTEFPDSLVIEMTIRGETSRPSFIPLDPGETLRRLKVEISWNGQPVEGVGVMVESPMWRETAPPEHLYRIVIPSKGVSLDSELKLEVFTEDGAKLGCMAGKL